MLIVRTSSLFIEVKLPPPTPTNIFIQPHTPLLTMTWSNGPTLTNSSFVPVFAVSCTRDICHNCNDEFYLYTPRLLPSTWWICNFVLVNFVKWLQCKQLYIACQKTRCFSKRRCINIKSDCFPKSSTLVNSSVTHFTEKQTCNVSII